MNTIYVEHGKKVPIVATNNGIRTVTLWNKRKGQDEVWICAGDFCKLLKCRIDHKTIKATVDPAERQVYETDAQEHILMFLTGKGCEQVYRRCKDPSQQVCLRMSYKGKDGIRTVEDWSGTLWLLASDVCQTLGFANVTQTIQLHTGSQNIKRILTTDAMTGRTQERIFLNKEGYEELTHAKLRKIKRGPHNAKNHKQEEHGQLPACTEPYEVQRETVSPRLWLPVYTRMTNWERRLVKKQVAIHFTYGSNWVLKGTTDYKPYEELTRRYDMSEEASTTFNQLGYLINYADEWNTAFQECSKVQAIPVSYQMTLDMLMSDFISRIRRTGRYHDNHFHVGLDVWTAKPVFEFNLLEWFEAFHYSENIQSTTSTQIGALFKSWSDKVMKGLCYMMKTGIIQPVQTIRNVDVENELRHILKHENLLATDQSLETVYTGELPDPYIYRFRFTPCWIQAIQSETLPSPVQIPPIIGRIPYGGRNYGYKYTCNRLLCAELHNKERKKQVRNDEVWNLRLKQYCLLTGIPLYSNWATYSNSQYNSTKKEQYERSMIRNTIEAFKLFKVVNITWSDAGRRGRYVQTADNASIAIKPLYQL